MDITHDALFDVLAGRADHPRPDDRSSSGRATRTRFLQKLTIPIRGARERRGALAPGGSQPRQLRQRVLDFLPIGPKREFLGFAAGALVLVTAVLA